MNGNWAIDRASCRVAIVAQNANTIRKKRSLGTLTKPYRTASQMDLKETFGKSRRCTKMTSKMLFQNWRKTKLRVATTSVPRIDG